MPSVLAERQRARQEALLTLLLRELATVWRLLTPTDLVRTLPALVEALNVVVQRYGTASAAVAADYYVAERAAARVPGRFVPAPADPPPLERVKDATEWSVRSLWADPTNTQAAETQFRGVAEQLVLHAGRDTIVTAVQQDPQARAWARVTKPGACPFCLLLSTRGAVYKSEASASFEAHDGDRCVPEAVFGEYEMTADARYWEQVYIDSTRGLSGAAARNAFRQAVAAERAAPAEAG